MASCSVVIYMNTGTVGAVSTDFCAKFNPLKTKCRLLYLNTQFVPRSKHFSSRLYRPISLSVYAVSGTSRCLFSDKYKTHKIQCG